MKRNHFVKGLATLAVAAMLTLSPATVFAAENTSSSSDFNDASALSVEANRSIGVRPMWVMPGKHVQNPNEGGTWEYGFWDVKYRSYYTVNRCHGSTVISGDRTSKSVDTASGKQSIAELWAINNPWADPHYYYRVC